MKKKQFKYVCHGRKYSCLLLVSYLSNNIEMLWQFNSILLLLFQISILHHWICKCTLLVFGRRCKQRDRWNYSTRKVGKFAAEKSLRLTALEKSKFLAKSINLETIEGCHSNCERKLVERVARRSKLISDSSQLIHWQELNSSSK